MKKSLLMILVMFLLSTSIVFAEANITGYLWHVDGNKIYKLTTNGTVVDSFAGPGGWPYGLTWDGTYLWSTDAVGDTIYKLTTNGTVVDSFASPGTGPMGLAWDGTYLWNIDDQIYKLTTNGTVVTNFSKSGGSSDGLTFDGTYLWYAADQIIYKLTTNGTVITNFSSPGNNPEGLTFDGTYLWNANFDSQIYKLTMNGTVVDSFPSPGINPHGLAWMSVVPPASNCTTPIDGMNITQDTTFCPGNYNLPNGITISSDNIILECNDTTLNGTDVNNGIYLDNRNYVTIKECNVRSYENAIILKNSNNNILTNNNISNVSWIGIGLESSDNNQINDNYAFNNKFSFSVDMFSNNNILENNYERDGVIAYSIAGDNNTLKNNIAINNQDGFALSWSDDNLLINNTAEENWFHDYYLRRANNNKLISNVAIDGSGIYVSSNSNNNIISNNTLFITPDAIVSESITITLSSHNNIVDSNKILGNHFIFKSGDIMIQQNSTHNQVINNLVNNSRYGIFLLNVSDNNILNNIFSYNERGIELTLSSVNNLIQNNTIYGADEYNLYVDQSDNVSASNNYWGTTNKTEIQNKIYDYDDDNSRGVVDFCPYLDAPYPFGNPVSCEEVKTYYTLDGTVTTFGSGGTVHEANVVAKLDGEIINSTVTSGGYYSLTLPNGTYRLEASKLSYRNYTNLSVSVSGNSTYDFSMIRFTSKGRVNGNVTNSTGGKLTGAILELEVDGGIVNFTTTDINGEYSISNTPGEYNLTASAPGFIANRQPVTLYQRDFWPGGYGNITLMNFTLLKTRPLIIYEGSDITFAKIGDIVTITTNWSESNLSCELYANDILSDTTNSGGSSLCSFVYNINDTHYPAVTFHVNATNNGGRDGISEDIVVDVGLDATIPAGTSIELDFQDVADTTLTLYSGSGVSGGVASVIRVIPASLPSGWIMLKTININVNAAAKTNTDWTLIEINYTDTNLTTKNIDENSLTIFYFNETANAWQQEAIQNVVGASNYVWTNVTHFSIFGAFGKAPVSPTPSSGGGGGGRAPPCDPSWSCDVWSECVNSEQNRICQDMNGCFLMKTEKQECVIELEEEKEEEQVESTGMEAITGAVVKESREFPKTLITAGSIIVGVLLVYLIVFMLLSKLGRI